jgi:chromosome segregation ATPase
MQANELSKTSNQRQSLLEGQLRDLRLTSEKYQLSTQGQLEEYSKQAIQHEDQINALETMNNLLKEELNSCQADNQCLLLMSKQDKDLAQDLQQQLDQLREQYRSENELAQNQIETLRTELNEKDSDQQAYMALKTSFTEIEKRCVKHQKTEIEVKRQLTGYQSFINDLQREIQDLTERLSAGADEYKTLFRKYTALERSMNINQQQEKVEPINEATFDEEELISVLRNTHENQQQDPEPQIPSTRTSMADIDVEERQCPMCYWQFPEHMTLDGKREHIEQHFQ